MLVPILVQLTCPRVAPFQQTRRWLNCPRATAAVVLLSGFCLSSSRLGFHRSDPRRNLAGAILQQIEPAAFALPESRGLRHTHTQSSSSSSSSSSSDGSGSGSGSGSGGSSSGTGSGSGSGSGSSSSSGRVAVVQG